MNNTPGGRIREMRNRKGLSQEQLGRIVGRSKGTVSQWESNETNPGGSVLLRLAQALECTPDYIVEGGQQREPRAVYSANSNVSLGPSVSSLAPEISWVQAGQWAEVCQADPDPDNLSWHPRIAGGEQTFVLRVVGESMLPDYPPGRLIFVDPERAPDSGDDVIAILTDTNEATFKRLVEEPGSGRLLKALNPSWRDPYLPINGNCRIIGVVVADMRLR